MFATYYQILDVPVSMSDRELRAEINRRWLNNSDMTPKDKERFRRGILRQHRAARDIYARYRF